MSNCVICALPLFIAPMLKSGFTYNAYTGEPCFSVGYIWYIKGPKEKILVDAGGDPERLVKLGIPARHIQSLESALNEVGLSPRDIDLIILTHLHDDHLALASKYPKARMLVQKKELEFTQNPHSYFAGGYAKELLNNLKFEVIDGDTRINDDVSVLLTPGHTPGGQSVSIKTEQGVAIIAGFCSIKENFEPVVSPTGAKIAPFSVPHLHTNILDAYDTILRIKQTANIIVPLHGFDYLLNRRIPCIPLSEEHSGKDSSSFP